MEEYKT